MLFSLLSLDDNLYIQTDDGIYGNFINKSNESKEMKPVIKYFSEYYQYYPHYFYKKLNVLKSFERSLVKNLSIYIEKDQIDFFITKIMLNDLSNNDLLFYILNCVHNCDKSTQVIFGNKKISDKNTTVINETKAQEFINLFSEYNRFINILDKIKNNQINQFYYDTKLSKNKPIKKSLYHKGLLSQFLNTSVLPYSQKTLCNKTNEADIIALSNTINKLASKLNIEIFTRINEESKLTEAIQVGEKILNIKKENTSKKKIQQIYNAYLKNKNFNKYFKETKYIQLEKLWEAYITKYAPLIFQAYEHNIENQFELKTTDRTFKPDFVIKDIYGGRTIIEIKTHLPLATGYDPSHKSIYFSNDTSKGIGQLQGYLKNATFISDDTAKYFSSARGILIIGCRKMDVANYKSKAQTLKETDMEDKYYKELRDLKSSLYNIEIMHFDDLIDNLKQRLIKLKA